MPEWLGEMKVKWHGVRMGGNTLLRVRCTVPQGSSPAAAHLRDIAAAFCAYADQKGRERYEKKQYTPLLYTLRMQAEERATCTVLHLLFSFGGERPDAALVEYWQGAGLWQTAHPPRAHRRFFKKTHKNATKPLEIQKKI